MLWIAINIFALLSLILSWLMADAEFRTKVIFTVIFLFTVAWAFLEPLTGMVDQGCLGAVLWWLTFGSRGR